MEQKITTQTLPAKLTKRQMVTLICAALFLDFLSLFPGQNVVVSLLGQTTIPFLFSRYGVNIFSFKTSVPYIIAFIIEIIPGASILPGFTLETIIILYLSNKELQK